MRHYQEIVVNQSNVFVPNATVSVYLTGTTTLATIYSNDIGTVKPNPLTTDAEGRFDFWIADGRYDITITGSGIGTTTLVDQEISDILQAAPSDLSWQTELIGFVNQSTVPPTPPTGTTGLYTLASNKHIYIQDDTGHTTDLTVGSGGGGTTPGAPTNSLQKNSGASTFVASNVVDNGTTVSINSDTVFLGPNPYTDARQFGVRAINPSLAPAIPGITATIGLSSTTATLSSPSTFQNGDGVCIYGAGNSIGLLTPAAPTVLPCVAAAGTGTGLVILAPSGSITYNYQVVARTTNGGLTAAGGVGSTSTGGTLGSQSVSISTSVRSSTTVTVTTTSAHGLVPGSMVYIQNTNNDTSFGGWYVVATTADNLHFTYTAGQDTLAGAPTSSTGGQAFWFNCNHLSWTPVTGAFEYYIYGRTGGSLNLIGVSRPQNASQGLIDATWDDFGSPMMDGILLPYFVPATPPTTSLNNPLVTTIVSGGGTSTLTLAASAVNAVNNATILFDNTPNIQTAASLSNYVVFPVSPIGSYVTNSFCTIPANVTLSIGAATLALNDTLQLTGGGNKLLGMTGVQGSISTSFGWPAGGTITVYRANPGIWMSSANAMYVNGIQVNGINNGQLLMVMDGGPGGAQNQIWNTNFQDGSPGSDYMGMCFLKRGGFWDRFDTVSFNTGPGQFGSGFAGSSATPAAFFSNGGSITLKNMSVQDRGMFFIPDMAGPDLECTGTSRAQGGIMPFLTVYFGSGLVGGHYTLSDVEIDTAFMPIIANLASNNAGFGGSLAINGGSGSSNLQGATVTGKPFALSVGNIIPNNIQTISNYAFTNNFVSVNGVGQVGFQMVAPGAPGISIGPGGNFPVGPASYAITAVDVNGNESVLGNFTNFTTTSGNQTVTVSSPAQPKGAIGWRPYRCGPNGLGCIQANITVCGATVIPFGTNFVDTFSFGCGNNPPIPRAAAAAVGPNGLSGYQTILTPTFFANLPSAVNGTLIYCSDCTITSPCSGGGTGAFAKRLNGTWVCN